MGSGCLVTENIGFPAQSILRMGLKVEAANPSHKAQSKLACLDIEDHGTAARDTGLRMIHELLEEHVSLFFCVLTRINVR